MTQNAEHVLDHFDLFRGPEYQEMLANKRKLFENQRDPAEVERITEWAKTEEYKEKNFAREALTINPAKACQPLGAVFVAVGFEKTIPFVHGSQGCVAYYRSPLLASLQGADLVRVLFDDRRCGGVRRPQQHDRRSGQHL